MLGWLQAVAPSFEVKTLEEIADELKAELAQSNNKRRGQPNRNANSPGSKSATGTNAKTDGGSKGKATSNSSGAKVQGAVKEGSDNGQDSSPQPDAKQRKSGVPVFRKDKTPPKRDPMLESLKHSVATPYVPVPYRPQGHPPKSLSSTAMVSHG